MSGTKQKRLSFTLDFHSRDNKRFIAVSEQIQLIAARGPSPADLYLEEEFNNFSKYANQSQAAINPK